MPIWHISINPVPLPSMSRYRPKTIYDSAYLVLVDCLRLARQEAKITQVELASKLGTDQSHVSKYEHAERRLDFIEIRTICSALGRDFPEFIAVVEEQLKKKGL